MAAHLADKMSQTQAVERILERLEAAGIRGFFRPRRLREIGLNPNYIPTLLRSGMVERVSRGLYRFVDSETTENYSIEMVCARVPTSVICLLSALRLHGIGSQSPREVWLAIPHKARLPEMPQPKLRIVRFGSVAWSLGVQDFELQGIRARLTTPARTVVDCFRFERLVGAETAMEALTEALRQKRTTVDELSQLVERMPSRRLRAALDVISI